MNRRSTIASVAAILCFTLAAVLAIQAGQADTPTPRTVHVLATPSTPTPTAAPLPYTGPIALTVNPTATMAYSPTLEPADFTNVFQLVDPAHGYYATGGTRYLVAHSYAAGSGAPGNAWEHLHLGDVVSSGGRLYRVNYISTPGKDGISAEPIWNNDSNEMVWLTCLSRGPGNPATNNFVIRFEAL